MNAWLAMTAVSTMLIVPAAESDPNANVSVERAGKQLSAQILGLLVRKGMPKKEDVDRLLSEAALPHATFWASGTTIIVVRYRDGALAVWFVNDRADSVDFALVQWLKRSTR